MNDPVCQPPKLSIPWALLGAVLLVMGVESSLGQRDLFLLNREAANHRFPGTVLPEASRAEILCFGDSLVKQGVVPRVLEQQLGKRTYNLAIGGGMPAATFFLFRKALENGARPSVVMVDFEPVMLSIGANHSENRLAEIASFRDCLDVGWNYRSPPFFATLMTAWSLTSIRHRLEIRGRIAASLSGERYSLREPITQSWQSWQTDQGVQLNPDVPAGRKRSPFWNERYAKHLPRRLDWRSEAYVVRFLELARCHRIPVYWLLPPVHPEIRARWDVGGATAFYTEFVRGMQKRFPDLTVVDARSSGYSAERFFDTCHLDGTGALAFSAQVAEALGRFPPSAREGPRWVSLTADRIETIGRVETTTNRGR